jgi:hypothetical protein
MSRSLDRQADSSAAGVPNPLLHLYYWLRWQMFGTVLPDEAEEGYR